jgi:hypothetical protein
MKNSDKILDVGYVILNYYRLVYIINNKKIHMYLYEIGIAYRLYHVIYIIG